MSDIKKLPVYNLQIDSSLDSDLEVSFVALVDAPAIEKNFLAFKEQEKKLQFAVDEARQIISGPAMLAGVPIYRNDDIMGEYMVQFDAVTIMAIAQKFFAKGFNQNFNLMHDPAKKVAGVCIFESFIVDDTRGIKPMAGFEDAQNGSWFLSAKVNNPQVWADIKAGTVKGFSVEGQFAYEKKKFSDEQALFALHQLLNDTE
jgi:Putative phage serine protease XkdF